MPFSFGLSKNFRSSEFRDPAVLYGDYFIFNYRNTDGSDFDIRAGILNPAVPGLLGWGANNTLVVNGITVAFWAGDQTGIGVESFYIDKAKMLQAFPSLTSIEVDLRAFWYGTVGTNPIIMNMDAYQGGTMIDDGLSFSNPTAENEFPSSKSFAKLLTLKTQNTATNGQRLARAFIDFDNSTLTYIGA
jgi:hypothetical protein